MLIKFFTLLCRVHAVQVKTEEKRKAEINNQQNGDELLENRDAKQAVDLNSNKLRYAKKNGDLSNLLMLCGQILLFAPLYRI